MTRSLNTVFTESARQAFGIALCMGGITRITHDQTAASWVPTDSDDTIGYAYVCSELREQLPQDAKERLARFGFTEVKTRIFKPNIIILEARLYMQELVAPEACA